MLLTQLERSEFLEISLDAENGYLYVDWKGYQTDKSIKEGCERIVELMTRFGVFKVLNDNTNTLGIWLGVSHWLIFDILPRARKAGMTAFAHVYGPSRMSRVSAEAALILLAPATRDIKTFERIDEARAWLIAHS